MKTIITIGRQFGSGGKEVGIRVAKELGIPFYDKELLRAAAEKSGLCEKIFENFDERPKSLLVPAILWSSRYIWRRSIRSAISPSRAPASSSAAAQTMRWQITPTT